MNTVAPLLESLEEINKQLADKFGINSDDLRPIFRVAWSEYTEKRLEKFTPEGIERLFPEVIEVPKYNYIKDRWILERLVIVPEQNQDDIPVSKLSYEPIWVFEDFSNNALPPRLDACILIIDTVNAASGKNSLKRYKDKLLAMTPEAREEALKKLEEQLFGDESQLLGRTVTGEAIAMPQNYNRSMQEN